MPDLYMKMNGDISLNAVSDIALVDSVNRHDVQQIYIRLMTEPGDFYLYPKLGTELSRLYGMPQSYETGEYGKALIANALNREGLFRSKSITIVAVPTSEDTIRFDVKLITEYRDPVVISVSQDL